MTVVITRKVWSVWQRGPETTRRHRARRLYNHNSFLEDGTWLLVLKAIGSPDWTYWVQYPLLIACIECNITSRPYLLYVLSTTTPYTYWVYEYLPNCMYWMQLDLYLVYMYWVYTLPVIHVLSVWITCSPVMHVLSVWVTCLELHVLNATIHLPVIRVWIYRALRFHHCLIRQRKHIFV